jgi:hypothetical protein
VSNGPCVICIVGWVYWCELGIKIHIGLRIQKWPDWYKYVFKFNCANSKILFDFENIKQKEFLISTNISNIQFSSKVI